MSLDDIVKGRYTYNADEGVLTSRKTGDPVGHVKRNGYMRVDVDGKTFAVHRVCWFLHYGKWPQGDIDHINHDRKDNRICNLRVVDRKTNMRNASKSAANKSGFTGVGWCKQQNKWYAAIMVDGKNIKLGRYDALIDAIASRMRANKKYGFHANHGAADA